MVELGGGIDVAANAMALAIAANIRDDADAGWGAPIPAYDSVLVPFDPDRLDPVEAEGRLRACIAVALNGDRAGVTGRLHRIPVRYGGADGPDLERGGRSPRARTRAGRRARTPRSNTGSSCSASHPASAISDALPPELTLPRRDEPRPRVPAGSVAIAGWQTAIYPSSTPGGWHLIGRTSAVMWDARRAEPALLAAGDRVRFEPVSG